MHKVKKIMYEQKMEKAIKDRKPKEKPKGNSEAEK